MKLSLIILVVILHVYPGFERELTSLASDFFKLLDVIPCAPPEIQGDL